MELRAAELDDLGACAAIPAEITSTHVWQLSLTRDPTASLATSEFSVALRCLRLPRQVVISPPGEPLDMLWQRAAAVFCAADETLCAGYIVLTRAEEREAVAISRLVVTPELRRRRIGTALLRVAARWGAAEGLQGLTAHCSARNHPAVAFFTRSGFTFAGYSEAYYPRGEVALFWQRSV